MFVPFCPALVSIKSTSLYIVEIQKAHDSSEKKISRAFIVILNRFINQVFEI